MVAFMARMLTDLTVYRRLYEPHNEELWIKGRASQLALVEALRTRATDAARAIMREHMEARRGHDAAAGSAGHAPLHGG
jgi:GntR family transcriptional repressor for pyruvate dehydrogenase complex